MNIVLSLLVSLIMLFTGVDVLPDTPDTMYAFRIHDILFSIGQEQVLLEPQARLSTAVGAKEAALSFALDSGGKAFFPAHIHLDGENIRFALSDQLLFTILDDDLSRILNLANESDVGKKIHFATALFATLPGFASAASNPEEMQSVVKAWAKAKGVSAKKASISIDGSEISLKTYKLKLTPKEMLKGLSALKKSEHAHLRKLAELAQGRYRDAVLRELNYLLPKDVKKIPFEISFGSNDETAYLQMANDNLQLEAISDDRGVHWDIRMEADKAAGGIRLDLLADLSAESISIIADGELAGNAYQLVLHSQKKAQEPFALSLAFESDLLSFDAKVDQDLSDSDMPLYRFLLNASRPGGKEASLSFSAESQMEPFEDPFVSLKTLKLTSNTESENFDQLKRQLLAWAIDAAKLLMEPSVVSLTKLDFASLL